MGVLSILTIIPILIIFLLLTWKNVATEKAALIGWVLCILDALFFFHTPVSVSIRASIAGVFQSFPITLMVLFAILQIGFMESTGALRRISIFLRTLAPTNKAAQIMTINLGTGTLLVSAGATPVAVLPPIMKGMGYSNFMAIALPALGFDALCTYSMLGAPMVAYSDIAGIPLVDAAKIFSCYLPVISTCLAFAMLYLVGGKKLMKDGFIPALFSGLVAGFTAVAVANIPALQGGIVLTGVFAGVLVILCMLLYLKLTGQKIIDRSKLTKEDLAFEKEMSLLTALSPWIIMIAALLFVNFYKPVTDFLMVKLAMPIQIIPGTTIKLRMAWNAYTYTLLATIVSAIWLKPTTSQVKETLSKWGHRAPAPMISLTVFFALGLLMNNTGVVPAGDVWKVVDPMHNMISVLALESAKIFGAAYPFITAPLGLFGGFVTSSEASALAMFAKYNIIASKALGLNALIVTAATGMGAGLSSVISPGKLQNAAAVIDALGEEQAVIRKVFPICIVLIIICAITCFILTKIM